jgi:O-methyltransferase involved in polyketide biosynthesis
VVTNLVDIEGIAETYAAKLQQAGVGTVEALLSKGATPAGRRGRARVRPARTRDRRTMIEQLRMDAVPETMLWTLYHRAAEARRPDRVLSDEVGVELIDRIGFPNADRFGPANPLLAQAQALRARRFDLEVERFLASHQDGTVVALGEGLETQFWRVDNGLVRWMSVDLEEPIAARRQLLPPSPRQRTVTASVLDERCIDQVDPSRGVLITAQGLLMYLKPAEAHQVILTCAQRFPGSSSVFDVVPQWFSERTMKGMRNAAGYQPPAMPWGADAAERRRLARLPGVGELRELRLPRGRGPFYGLLAPLLGRRLPRPLQYLAPWSILRVRFGAPDARSQRRAAVALSPGG